MNSFSDYVPGSATRFYRAKVDEAAALAERQKGQVDPIHHERIDRLLDTFARKLADNINRRNEIAARVPSILIAGGGNFPVRKKEKQNQADAAAMEEYRQIRGLLDKIRGAGRGGISADDPAAVDKLKAKLAGLEAVQEKMKAVNAYYRKHGTLEGCPQLSAAEIEELKAGMARSWRAQPRPYESYLLTNNNANIHRVKERIEELTKRPETEFTGWAFDGGEVKVNQEANRLQVFFAEKPDRETCSAMRHGGFKWAPSVGAWQRQLTGNAIYAAKHLDCLRPLSGERPAPEQAEPVQEPAIGMDSSCSAAVMLEDIAAKYYEFQHLCYPLEKDDTKRQAWMGQIVQYIQNEGKCGAKRLALMVVELASQQPDNMAIQSLASELGQELRLYDKLKVDDASKQKAHRKNSMER